MKTIQPQAVAKQTNPFILDVRIPTEYRAIHVQDSVLLPLHTLDPAKVKELAGNSPCYIMCRSGNRATDAAQKLEAAGVKDVAVIEGGILAWDAAGLPVNRGKSALTLERQVRIAAGSMALAGAVLAWTVNPAWILLSGFVGAGLIFAGVTNLCPMANLIAMMPWNNTGTECGSCCTK